MSFLAVVLVIGVVILVVYESVSLVSTIVRKHKAKKSSAEEITVDEGKEKEDR